MVQWQSRWTAREAGITVVPVPAERTSFTPSDCWPFLDLRATAGDLELRYLDDNTLFELAQLAGSGVHAEDQMPFLVPWTRGNPLHVARSVLAYQWAARAKIAPQHWVLELAVVFAVGAGRCAGALRG